MSPPTTCCFVSPPSGRASECWCIWLPAGGGGAVAYACRRVGTAVRQLCRTVDNLEVSVRPQPVCQRHHRLLPADLVARPVQGVKASDRDVRSTTSESRVLRSARGI